MNIKSNNTVTIRGIVKSYDIQKSRIRTSAHKRKTFEQGIIRLKCGLDTFIAEINNSPSEPKRVGNMYIKFPNGTTVEATGRLSEREYEVKGQTRVDRKPIINRMEEIDGEYPFKGRATFCLAGIVSSIKEKDEKVEFDIDTLSSHEDENKNLVYTVESFSLYCCPAVYEEFCQKGFEIGANIDIAGTMVNKLQLDEYECITGMERCLCAEKMHSVVSADETEELDDFESYKKAKSSDDKRYVVKAADKSENDTGNALVEDDDYLF